MSVKLQNEMTNWGTALFLVLGLALVIYGLNWREINLKVKNMFQVTEEGPQLPGEAFRGEHWEATKLYHEKIREILGDSALSPLEKTKKIDAIVEEESVKALEIRMDRYIALPGEVENIGQDVVAYGLSGVYLGLDFGGIGREVYVPDSGLRINLNPYPTYQQLQANKTFVEFVSDIEGQGLLVEYIQEVPDGGLSVGSGSYYGGRKNGSFYVREAVERYGKENLVADEIVPEGIVQALVITLSDEGHGD